MDKIILSRCNDITLLVKVDQTVVNIRDKISTSSPVIIGRNNSSISIQTSYFKHMISFLRNRSNIFIPDRNNLSLVKPKDECKDHNMEITEDP